MVNYSDVVSSDDESAYELIGSSPNSADRLPKIVKRPDSDEKDAKIEDLEKMVAEMTSQLEESNQKTENAFAANSDILSKLEEMTKREQRIMRIAREYQLRLEYAENQLDTNHGMKEIQETKDERVQDLEKKLAEKSSQLEQAIRIAREYELSAEYAENQLGKKLLEAQHSCDDKLRAENEGLLKMKTDLEKKEGAIRQLNDTITELNKNFMESEIFIQNRDQEISNMKIKIKEDLDVNEGVIRQLTAKNEKSSNTISELNKKLMETEEKLHMKNQDESSMKRDLNEMEEEQRTFTRCIQQLSVDQEMLNNKLRANLQKLRAAAVSEVRAGQGIFGKTLKRVAELSIKDPSSPDNETTSRFVDVNKKRKAN